MTEIPTTEVEREGPPSPPAGRIPRRPDFWVRRHPWIAAIASLVLPGLGQVYNGQMLKGATFLAAMFAAAAMQIFGIFSPSGNAPIYFGSFVASGVIRLWSTLDAALGSRGRIDFVPPRPMVRIALCVMLGVAFYGVRPLISDRLGASDYFREFARTNGMSPVVLDGDMVVFDRRASAFPPGHGDVVMVASGDAVGSVAIARVVAVGGEEIEIRDRVLYLGGRAVHEPYARHTDSVILQSANGRDQFGPLRLGDEEIFVLGDNREESLDSRFLGPIGKDAVLGKAMWVIESWDFGADRRRGERVGQRIR